MIRNEDGSVTVTTVIEAEKVQALEFVYPSFTDLINDIENPATEEALKVELAAAEDQYQKDFVAGEVDGAIFLDKVALREWFRAHPSYMNAAERKAAKEAEIAEAEAELKAAEDAIS